MKIGKFEIEIMYDMRCNCCGEYRTNIGWTGSLFTKPTVATIMKEGWRIIDGNQVCPSCVAKIRSGE